MAKIILESDEGKLGIKVEGEVNFPDSVIMLASALRKISEQTVKAVSDQFPDTDVKEIRGDIADMINYAVSNVLNEICPTTREERLSEIAIATMENNIIHKAKAEGKTLDQALKEYEDELIRNSPYPAFPSNSRPKPNLKLIKPKKKKK